MSGRARRIASVTLRRESSSLKMARSRNSRQIASAPIRPPPRGPRPGESRRSSRNHARRCRSLPGVMVAMVTSHPASRSNASVPAHWNSTSSGWAWIAKTRTAAGHGRSFPGDDRQITRTTEVYRQHDSDSRPLCQAGPRLARGEPTQSRKWTDITVRHTGNTDRASASGSSSATARTARKNLPGGSSSLVERQDWRAALDFLRRSLSGH